jgi:hypothetical protein
MPRIFLTIIVLFVLALVLGPFLPPPLSDIAAWYTGIVSGLICPMFLLSLLFAPGIWGNLSSGMRHMSERISSRRQEVEELRHKIHTLGKPHHMIKLGAIYVRQGRTNKAELLFRQALELEPDLVEPRYQLGLCRYEKQDYAAAAQCMEAACAEKADYGYGLAQLRLAQSLDQLGDDRAADIYAEFLQQYHAHPEGSVYYAQLLTDRGEHSEAAGVLREMVRASRVSPGYQRRRNRHWIWKAQWRLWRNHDSNTAV